MYYFCEEAAEQLEEEGISAEILDLRTLRPLDEEAILATVRKTNRVVIVEEGWPLAGVGAQVVDIIQSKAFDDLDAPVAARDGPGREHVVRGEPGERDPAGRAPRSSPP